MILLEYQNIKTLSHNAMLFFQSGLKKFLWLKNLKTLCRGHMLTAEKFYQNELQQTNQIEFRFEEVIKRKGDRLHVKGKGYDSSLHS